jgi:polysaccharide export outer membrane protein
VTLPTSGPSVREVQASASRGIEVMDVADVVTHQLRNARAAQLFSESLGKSADTGRELVGPGDILEVSVWEAPPAVLFSSSWVTGNLGNATPTASVGPSSVATLPQQMVAGDGTIYVPFAGKVSVGGKKLHDIESDITHRLERRANRPQVLVRLIVNNTAYVTVVGDVTNSVRMPLTPRGEHLLDALAVAGGTKDPVDKINLQVTRGSDVYSMPLDTVIRDPRQNVSLQAGDVVTALFEPFSFTALGATGKSDEVNFEAKGISLAQALARIGGVIDSRANAQGVFIFRFEASDALQWPEPPSTTPEGKVPVVYRLDLTDPKSFFVAQSFRVENKDLVYVANASAAQLQKFLNLVVSTVYPIQGVVTLTK